MKNKVFKNLFLTVSTSIPLIISLLIIIIFSLYYQDKYLIILTFLSLTIYLIIFMVAISVVFTVAKIDFDGITFMLFKKVKKFYSWDQITDIKKENNYRNWCYALYLPDGETKIFLDYRKKVKKLLLYYCPDEELKQKILNPRGRI